MRIVLAAGLVAVLVLEALRRLRARPLRPEVPAEESSSAPTTSFVEPILVETRQPSVPARNPIGVEAMELVCRGSDVRAIKGFVAAALASKQVSFAPMSKGNEGYGGSQVGACREGFVQGTRSGSVLLKGPHRNTF